MSEKSVNTKIMESIKENLGNKPVHVLLCCSGGPDSQVLVTSFAHCNTKYKLGHTITVVSIDHGLREEAPLEVDLVRQTALKHGLNFVSEKLDLKKGSNIQSRARDARYDAIFKVASKIGANIIATAHTMDDVAETVIMRILRSCTIHSLGVLPATSNRKDFKLFRPMISVTRKQVEEYCKRYRIQFATDPSNMNTKYTRVKIRKEILPLLEEMNPTIKERLAMLAKECYDS